MQDSNNIKTIYTVGDQFHSGMTIRGLFTLWLPSVRNQISPSSYDNYERIVRRHILPELGDCEVDLLTVTDINDFLKEKLKKRAIGRQGRALAQNC